MEVMFAFSPLEGLIDYSGGYPVFIKPFQDAVEDEALGVTEF